MIYLSNLEMGYRRLRSFLNRDICSDSVGCFDRYFWGWKKRDFQDATLAFASIPLKKTALRLGLEWATDLELSASNVCRLQHSDGSFDQSYPNEKHPKVGLDFSSVLYTFLQENRDVRIEKCYRKLVDYSLLAEETYGTISNHLAHHFYEYLLAFDYFGSSIYIRKACEILSQIEVNTHEEGWHCEYMGADPGYQTRTLRYLTKALPLLEGKMRLRCEELCLHSVRFLDKVVLPDGTLYGAFGSRNNAILNPSGIERMARMLPADFSNLVRRVRQSISCGRCILPLQLEFDNFIRLFDDFLDAQKVLEDGEEEKIYAQKVLEDGKEEKIHDCPAIPDYQLSDYGFIHRRLYAYDVFIQVKYGGAVAVYHEEECICRDGGLIFEDKKGGFYGTKNLLDFSRMLEREEGEIRCECTLAPSVHEELTPFKLIILRFLNLTFLRLTFLAELFRKAVVGRLIIGRQSPQVGHNLRTVRLLLEGVEICDEFSLQFVPRRIWRLGNVHLFHMASSRYFHPVEDGLGCNIEIPVGTQSNCRFVKVKGSS